jgi:DNA-binding NtrC family response regulator
MTDARPISIVVPPEPVRSLAARTAPCDVRVVAATSRRLARDVQDGWFRLHLYDRLSVIAIERMEQARQRG